MQDHVGSVAVPAWLTRIVHPPIDPEAVRRYADLLGERLPEVQSIVYAPFPYGPDELLVVVKDSVPFVPLLHGKMMSMEPPGVRVSCLRQGELFELSIPGLVTPYFEESYAISVNWLKYASAVMFGADLRADIQVPGWSGTEALRPIWFAINERTNLFLKQMMNRDYPGMAANVAGTILYTILVVLLASGGECVAPEDVMPRFLDLHPSLEDLMGQVDRAFESSFIDDEHAYHLLFLADSFLRRMRRELVK